MSVHLKWSKNCKLGCLTIYWLIIYLCILGLQHLLHSGIAKPPFLIFILLVYPECLSVKPKWSSKLRGTTQQLSCMSWTTLTSVYDLEIVLMYKADRKWMVFLQGILLCQASLQGPATCTTHTHTHTHTHRSKRKIISSDMNAMQDQRTNPFQIMWKCQAFSSIVLWGVGKILQISVSLELWLLLDTFLAKFCLKADVYTIHVKHAAF